MLPFPRGRRLPLMAQGVHGMHMGWHRGCRALHTLRLCPAAPLEPCPRVGLPAFFWVPNYTPAAGRVELKPGGRQK
uniref:Uncharacterized protein n=1 Tax=Anas zonorhyncha TaxID=75864 RepID=A0A8B9VZG6_9AVES